LCVNEFFKTRKRHVSSTEVRPSLTESGFESNIMVCKSGVCGTASSCTLHGSTSCVRSSSQPALINRSGDIILCIFVCNEQIFRFEKSIKLFVITFFLFFYLFFYFFV
jgi:hypothetical protein